MVIGVRYALAMMGIVLALAILAASTRAAPNAADFGLTICGEQLEARPVATLDLPNGAAIYSHFPGLGATPEIDDAKGPLHDGPLLVGAFPGEVCGVPAYTPINLVDEPRFHDVLVVRTASGNSWYFGDVDFSSLVP